MDFEIYKRKLLEEDERNRLVPQIIKIIPIEVSWGQFICLMPCAEIVN